MTNSPFSPSPAGTFPLPDVILSNTPPPSPLRRARSCHAFFPEKTQIQPPSPLTPPATPGAAFDGDAGVEAAQASLSHIQEVRRRLLGSFSVSPRNLPQLSWPLPRPHNPPSARGATKEEVSGAPEMRRSLRQELDGEALGEEQQRWRLVGGELRMVADQFQLNRSKASKNILSFSLALDPHYTPFAPHPAACPSPLPALVSEWTHVCGWEGGARARGGHSVRIMASSH